MAFSYAKCHDLSDKNEGIMESCLLIKTLDDRCFFTSSGNYPQLIEFAKTVGAEVSIIQAEEPVEVLELGGLIKSLCDVTKGKRDAKYRVLEKKIQSNATAIVTFTDQVVNKVTKREATLMLAKEVREYVKARLLSGEILALIELSQRFGDKLSASALRTHVNVVRNRLSLEGHPTDKVGVGQYRLLNAQPQAVAFAPLNALIANGQ